MSLTNLTKELFERQSYLRADRNQYTICLKSKSATWLVLQAFPHILKGLERRATLVDLCVTIGRRVRAKLKLKPDGIAACQIGFWILISFFETGLLGYRLAKVDKKFGKKSKHQTYEIYLKNKEELFAIWEEIKEDAEIDLYPTNTPPEPWTSGIHSTGASLVKRGELELLKRLTPGSQPVVFSVVNKLAATPWVVNEPMLAVVDYYMEQEAGPNNPLPYKQETDHRRQQSKFIIADSCMRIARKHLGQKMYSLYTLDFRGRVYNQTAFLHSQGDDLAKGMIALANGKELGEEGLYWLLLHAANTFGNDKDTLDNRVEWGLQNYELLVSCGREPLDQTYWHTADKPWSFLSTCMELHKLQTWIDSGEQQETFVSNLVCYIDGSTNGLQHLTALSKDQDMAPYTSLCQTDLPGDVYSYIGQKVWKELEYEEAKLPAVVYDRFDEVFDTLHKLQEAYDKAPPKSELKARAWEAVQEYRNNNRKIREWLFPVYWRRITDPKLIRKIVKRNSMTLGWI